MFVFTIKNIRLQKKISISELSKITSLSRTYIREIENNKRLNVSLSVLYKIASALDVNVKELFYTTLDIKSLKEEMYQSIDDHGIDSSEVLKISQLIDLLINIDMNEKKN